MHRGPHFISRGRLVAKPGAISAVMFGALCTVSSIACGPSFQAVYEGDKRFEHCYALEENSSLSMQQKASCWDDWIHGYTYGQTRDRVDYALSRSRALRAGGALPTDEAMMQAAPGEGRESATPAPRSAFAPPPKTLSDVSDGGTTTSGTTSSTATSGVAALVPSEAPADRTGSRDGSREMRSVQTTQMQSAGSAASPIAQCADACRASWNGCRGKDASDAKKAPACDKGYRACLGACAK